MLLSEKQITDIETQAAAVREARIARHVAACAYRVSAAALHVAESRYAATTTALLGPPAQEGILPDKLPPETAEGGAA